MVTDFSQQCSARVRVRVKGRSYRATFIS